MTLRQVIERLEEAAMAQPAVKEVVRNDVFRLNTLPEAKYGVFAWTQGNHSASEDDDLITFAFTLFFVDRLLPDKGNELQIQSVGIEVLRNILASVSDDMDISEERFTTFNQRFTDECAGVFCNISVSVVKDTVCAEDYSSAEVQGMLLRSSDGLFFKTSDGYLLAANQEN